MDLAIAAIHMDAIAPDTSAFSKHSTIVSNQDSEHAGDLPLITHDDPTVPFYLTIIARDASIVSKNVPIGARDGAVMSMNYDMVTIMMDVVSLADFSDGWFVLGAHCQKNELSRGENKQRILRSELDVTKTNS